MKYITIIILTFILFSCKKENSDSNCIGCESCDYTNYYILNYIKAKNYKNNINELMQNDTCYYKDYSIKLFLKGDIVIESSYSNFPSCVEKMYFINKLSKFKIDSCSLILKSKDNNLLKTGNELGFSPLELVIDSNSIQHTDTTIFLSGIVITIIDNKGNSYSTSIPSVYIKI